MKKKRIALDLPPVKHQEIKTLASSLGMTIKDFTEQAIVEFIKKLKKRSK